MSETFVNWTSQAPRALLNNAALKTGRFRQSRDVVLAGLRDLI